MGFYGPQTYPQVFKQNFFDIKYLYKILIKMQEVRGERRGLREKKLVGRHLDAFEVKNVLCRCLSMQI